MLPLLAVVMVFSSSPLVTSVVTQTLIVTDKDSDFVSKNSKIIEYIKCEFNTTVSFLGIAVVQYDCKFP